MKSAWAIAAAVIGGAALAAAATPRVAQPEARPEPAIAAEDLRAGGDEHKRYFLIGPREGAAEPADGWKVLLILPGGDGSAEFHPFVKNIAAKALPDGYLVAQLVAPVWREDKNRIVWPTKGLPDDAMKFSTEEFIAAVVEDAAAKKKIDRRHVYALGWSSGGPPVYAASVTEGTPLTGAFVVMSVYKPELMPPLVGAKGKAYYLLHSPDDFIKMRFPEAAKKELTEAGAAVELQTYEGGHGWKGDVFGNIRRGVEWLEGQRAK
ncbi:MAG: alpha/beta hydrolase [Phycisphaerales bacterium]